MNLPYELLWGVDVAIKKLRPGASFTLMGTTFTEWKDPAGTEPPTWEEVLEQLEKDQLVAEKWILENSAS